MNLKASFNVHQTKKAFGKGTFAYGFKRHKERRYFLLIFILTVNIENICSVAYETSSYFYNIH